ncbi:MAG: aldo/keto reductase [Bacteroidetes bacterium]|jgi:diketogulonate reductase-like aldo/keto reductase|nr:aldo/keto reductase [Bacteroidota bacterium]
MNITDLQGTVQLRNNVEMPYVGLGVFQMSAGNEVESAVHDALEAGYIHIDTAAAYNNEEGVGKAIRESGHHRENIFVTSKVWNSNQGYDSTLKAFDRSLERLGMDYLDLFLIHWPVNGKYKDTWKALEKLYNEGKIKAIGVSNFLQHHLEDLMRDCNEVPMVNQMEFHPYLVQQSLLDFCQAHEIQYEAWSPLMQGKITKVPELIQMGEKYNKNAVQVVLRWNLQKGVVTIPKSTHKERIESNTRIFDFELSQEDMHAIDSLDRNQRIGPHPDHFG